MSLPAYLSITGEKQGLISQGASGQESLGRPWQEEFTDKIRVTSFDHQMEVPQDNRAGFSSGQRVMFPFYITKGLDKSSPLLKTALNTGEIITRFQLDLYRYTDTGTLENFYTITLSDARVVQHMTQNPDPVLHGAVDPIETVAFTFERIDWEHRTAGTYSSDSWSGRQLVTSSVTPVPRKTTSVSRTADTKKTEADAPQDQTPEQTTVEDNPSLSGEGTIFSQTIHTQSDRSDSLNQPVSLGTFGQAVHVNEQGEKA